MNSQPSPQSPRKAGLPLPDARRGIALVIVLSFIALLSVLVVAFLGSVRSELGSSSSFAASSDVKQRAQTAVNLVISQIQAATSQKDIAWASQPGLIRTYDAQGAEAAQYKLYSSSPMVETSFDPQADDVNHTPSDVPANWASRPAEYTDLNQPALTPDPLGQIRPDGTKPNKTFIAQYPILDPTALGSGIKGFSAVDMTGAAVSAPSPTENPLTAGNKLPMPVKWLYMLKDGQLRAIGSGGTIPDATKANPPVARLAFWADDESAKVNINTAAGDLWNVADDPAITLAENKYPGSYMDPPFSGGGIEGTMQKNAPLSHEYQRYPGHPATTYLTAALPGLTRDELYSITPRVTNLLNGADVSSKGGSFRTTYDDLTSTNAAKVKALPLSRAMPLYSSVDELLYVRATDSRNAQAGASSTALFTIPQIERAKFFLTAQSRAPEVTLFNTPRIAMWPQLADTGKRTALDKTIAFASTVSGQPYYFTRADPNSPTADYTNSKRNQELYGYLQSLTSRSIPGFAGSFQAKFGQDRNQVLTEMFDYIRSCINLVDTATGAMPYAGKVSTSTEARRVVRGLGHVVPIVIDDGTADKTRGFGRTETLYMPMVEFYATETDIADADKAFNSTANDEKDADGNITAMVLSTTGEKASAAHLVTKKMRAVFLINSYSPAQGVTRLVPDLVYEIEGLDSIRVAGNPMGFPGGARRVNFNRNPPNDDYARGGANGVAGPFWEDGAPTFKPMSLDGPAVGYPFFSDEVAVNAEARSPLDFKSDEITMKIYDKSGSTLLQTIRFTFPATKIPTPLMAGSYAYNFTATPTLKYAKGGIAFYGGYPTLQPDGSTMTHNYYQGPGSARQMLNQVTRALVPMGLGYRGDLRLVAAKSEVVNSGGHDPFVPADGYDTAPPFTGTSAVSRYQVKYDNQKPDDQSAGMLCGAARADAGGGWVTGYTGSLIEDPASLGSGLKYDQHIVQPNVTSGPYAFYPNPGLKDSDGSQMKNFAQLDGSDGNRHAGDWDTGISGTPDGPFINKADEGEVGSQAYSAYNGGISIGSLFSPNRQVPSPILFGSLSTGVKRSLPWQTLLFCPNPPAGNAHPGFGKSADGVGPEAKAPFTLPPDHLLLDLFSMPVVEPYAISEPFSTAGKVNLNYQIVPFTNINRSTGLEAVLRSTRIAAIPTKDAFPGTTANPPTWQYKNTGQTGSKAATEQGDYRLLIDIDETLKGFQARFDQNNMFRSASQICEMFLVPQGETIGSTPKWWSTGGADGKGFRLTGDNLRERPYSQIYSRLTTKSNTYTVHVRVQSLQQRRRTSAAEYATWDEKKDKVTGEYRASYIIERYLNPNLQNYVMGDPLTDYKFRTVSTKQFSP